MEEEPQIVAEATHAEKHKKTEEGLVAIKASMIVSFIGSRVRMILLLWLKSAARLKKTRLAIYLKS
jgi:hypothetical protein